MNLKYTFMLLSLLPFLLFFSCEDNVPSDIGISATSVQEGSSAGTTVGSLSVSDEDIDDSFIFSLTSDYGENASFSIENDQLKTAEVFDYETKSSYAIKIEVSDGTDKYSQDFTITVTDISVDGLYGGSFTGTKLADSSVAEDVVWTLDIDGNSGVLDILAPDGEYADIPVSIDESARTITVSHKTISPSTVQMDFSGSIAEDGDITGTGTLDSGADDSIEYNIQLNGVKNDEGYLIKGTLHCPAEDVGQNGKPYTVVVDSDGIGDNGGVVGYFQGVSGVPRTMCYLITEIPAGTWEVYAVLYTDAPDSINPERPPNDGEYSGNYGSTFTPTDNTGVYDIALSVFSE
jgi:hypothetical protein